MEYVRFGYCAAGIRYRGKEGSVAFSSPADNLGVGEEGWCGRRAEIQNPGGRREICGLCQSGKGII
jgi:hypothetical protein